MNETLDQNQPEQDQKDGRIIRHAIGNMAVADQLPDQIIDDTLTRSNETPAKISRVIEIMRSFPQR